MLMPKELDLMHPCGLHIAKGLSERGVNAIDGVQTRDMQTGYVWYNLPQGEIAGRVVAMSLCFFKQQLDRLSVAVIDEALYGSSWDDWTAEKEEVRAVATGRWLADVGYVVGKYPWGTVHAGTDPKTGDGSGSIMLT